MKKTLGILCLSLLALARTTAAQEVIVASRLEPVAQRNAARRQDPTRQADHLSFILDGVNEIDFPGVPGPVCVFGNNAFPVVVAHTSANPSEQVPVIAVATYERGRFVAFAHDGYLIDSFNQTDTGRMMINLIRWAAGKASVSKRNPTIGVRRYPKLLAFLQKEKLDARPIQSGDWLQEAKQLDVVICATDRLSDDEVGQLADYVKTGGAVLTANLGWAWLGYVAKPGQSLAADLPGNRLFGPAGITWSDGYTKTPPNRRLRIAIPAKLIHAGRAFEAIAAAMEGRQTLTPRELERASFILSRTLNALPPRDRLLQPRIQEFLKRNTQQLPVPTRRKKLKKQDALARALVALHTQQSKRLPPEKVTAHPAARVFPGSVPNSAKRVGRELRIDTSVPDWHSTGLYAVPGEVISISVAAAAINRGLTIRIGCHKDKLWHKSAWERIPEITTVTPITAETTKAANAFGGLVYVVVPKNCKLGMADVSISNCVQAPHFVLGKTDVNDWRFGIRDFPAPWAELETENIILTVPSADIRKLDFPDKLMVCWDKVLDADADLRTISRQRSRPERIVMDEQISAGYLHAGYPIMGQFEHGKEAVDFQTLKTKGNWGFYHELGHNHQHPDWTYRGMGEVTVNLFSLYCLETLNPGAPMHPAFTKNAVAKHIAKFKRDGKKGNPFMELVPYSQMQQEFGWDAYKKVFAEYEKLPKSERPKNDQQKRDQWLTRFSRTVGRNLGPFFSFWKIETTQAARESVKDLPVWMPSGLN